MIRKVLAGALLVALGLSLAGCSSVSVATQSFIVPCEKTYYHTVLWSPDGQHIAVASTIDGNRDIVVITPDGSVVRRIRRTGSDFYPAWLRVGNRE